MSRILILGGAGFIGSHLSLRLLPMGHTVTVLDSLSPQIHGQDPEASPLYRSIAGKVSFVRGDVTDRDALTKVIPAQDAIVHLAAETGTGQSMYEIDRYVRVNVGGTGLLLDILANCTHDVRRLVIASSRAIYGEGKYHSNALGVVYPGHRVAADMQAGDFAVKFPGGGDLTPIATDEGSRLHPSSIYGVTKQTQEQLVMTASPGIGIAPVALRYQNVYGPGQSLSNPYTGILSIFSNLVRAGKPINIFEDGTESRDFIFIDDVVSATVLAVEHEAAAGEVFNVGTGVPTSVIEVARGLNERLGGRSQIHVSGDFRVGDIRHNFADISRIGSRLGFVPALEFAAGLSRFCDWVRATVAAPGDYEGSLEEMKARGLLKGSSAAAGR